MLVLRDPKYGYPLEIYFQETATLDYYFRLFGLIYMMTSSNGNVFLRYWPFVRGIHRSPVNSPHKGQWRGALTFLICAWINGWVNNREAGDFRRHHAHYVVTVMTAHAVTNKQLCCSDQKPGSQKQSHIKFHVINRDCLTCLLIGWRQAASQSKAMLKIFVD